MSNVVVKSFYFTILICYSFQLRSVFSNRNASIYDKYVQPLYKLVRFILRDIFFLWAYLNKKYSDRDEK